MSSQIDERVVRMRFENSSFEKNVSKTLTTIEKLKEKLLFKNAEKGFEQIQKASDSVSFDHLSTSVDKLVDLMKSRTGIMGGIFEEVGSKIVGIVTNMTSSITHMIDQVTFEPITTGFQEYETQINAIQVIAANTGVLMNDVAQSMNMTTESVISSALAMEYAQDIWNTGRFGNGVDRVEALGDAYKQVQGYVNDIAYGGGMNELNDEMSESSTTMQDIYEALDYLNLYADKTIYNFTQMTDAIGQFTVQGVNLEDSVTAVQGLANLAAFTGTNATQAAHVMREAAKGLATGYIDMRDWISFETSGGMGGTMFQEQLVETASQLWKTSEAYREYAITASNSTRGLNSVLGENVENFSDWVEEQGRFRNSLKAGWINDQVLITTLHKFANDWSEEQWKELGYTEEQINQFSMLGTVAEEAATKMKTATQMWDAVTEAAQSTWTQSWTNIIGNYYEAQDLWTMVGNALGDFVGSFGEARNAALEFWHDSVNGRAKAIQGLVNVFTFLGNVIDMVRVTWTDVFPSLTGMDLIRFTMKFHAWTTKLKDAQPTIDAVASVLHLLFTVLKAGTLVAKTVLTTVLKFFKIPFSSKNTEGLSETIISIAQLIESLIDLESIPQKVGSGLSKFFELIKNIPFYILVAASTIGEFVKQATGIDVISIVSNTFNRIKMMLSSIRSGGLMGFFEYIRNTITEIKDEIGQALGISDKIQVIYDRLSGYAKSFAGKAGEFIKYLFGGEVTIQKVAVLGLIAAQFKAIFDALKTGSIVQKTAKSFKGIFDTVKEGVSDSLEAFQDTLQSIQNETNIKLIWSIIAVIIALTGALVVLSTLDTSKLETSSSIMVAMLSGLIGLLLTMKSTITGLPNNMIIQLAVGLFAISSALISLIFAIVAISFISYDDLTKGLLSIFLMFAMLAGVVKSFDHKRFRENIISASIGVNLIVTALYGLVGAIALMSFMSGPTLFKGITAIFFILIEIVGALLLLDGLTMGAKDILASSIGVMIITESVIALTGALVTLSLLNPDKLGMATLNLVSLLGLIILSLVVLSRVSLTAGANTVASAAAVWVITQAVIQMIGALALIEKLKLEPLTKSMGTLALIFVMLVVMTEVAGHVNAGKAIVVAVAVNMIVSSIYAIILAIQMLSVMDLKIDNFTEFSNKIVAVLLGIALIAMAMSRVSTVINSSSARTFAPRIMLSGNPIGKALTGLAMIILSITAGFWLLIEALKGLLEISDSWTSEKKDKLQKTLLDIVDIFKEVAKKIKEGTDSEAHPINDAIMNFIYMIIDDIASGIVYLLKALTIIAVAVGNAIIAILIGLLNGMAGVDLETYFDFSDSFETMGDSFVSSLDKIVLTENAPISKLINALISFFAIVIYGLGDAIINNSGPLSAAIIYLITAILVLIETVLATLGAIILGPVFDEIFGEDIDWSEYVDTFVENFKEYWTTGFKEIADFVKEYFNPFSVDWWARFHEERDPNTDPNLSHSNDGTGGGGRHRTNAIDETANSAENATKKLTEFDNTWRDVTNRTTNSSFLVEPKVDDDFNQKMFDIGEKGGQQSESGFRKAWDINSPSRVAEQDGEYVGEGFENGLTNRLANMDFSGIIANIRNDMQNIDATPLNMDGEFSSNAYPVFDLDNMNTQSFLSEMMNGFDNTNIGDNIGVISSDMANTESYMHDMNQGFLQNDGQFYDDTNLISEVQGLREDIGSLNSTMAGYKVVMDTNALVGQMVGPLDAALGERHVRQSRGN